MNYKLKDNRFRVWGKKLDGSSLEIGCDKNLKEAKVTLKGWLEMGHIVSGHIEDGHNQRVKVFVS